jgi:hypothetical protein
MNKSELSWDTGAAMAVIIKSVPSAAHLSGCDPPR